MSEAHLSVEPLFSTPMARFQVPDFDQEVLDVDEVDLENDPEWFQNPKQDKVWNHSSHHILLEPEYNDLKTMVESAIESYLYMVLSVQKDITIKHASSWLTIGLDGCATAEHLHTNSVYSGILYLRSLPNSGNLFFVKGDAPSWSSTTILPRISSFNILNSSSYEVQPNEGDVFVFPSHCRHGVTVNNSGTRRCALAFNYTLEGLISDTHTNYLKL